MDFQNVLNLRRTRYNLRKQTRYENELITERIKSAVALSPTSFNNQSVYVKVLYGKDALRIWGILHEVLPAVPEEKLDAFRKSEAVALFFTNTEIVEQNKIDIPFYADNFDSWAEQNQAMATINVWNTLTDLELSANLQHYNPVIDEKIQEEFKIDKKFKLRSQLVFGENADADEVLPDKNFDTYKNFFEENLLVK
jgi:predicted oxidoreductase (fatty acid repression mutant protein)